MSKLQIGLEQRNQKQHMKLTAREKEEEPLGTMGHA